MTTSPISDLFTHALKRIPERRWNAIASEWLQYVGDHRDALIPTEHYIDSIPFIEAMGTATKSSDAYCEAEIPFVRTILFSEALYFQLRACNVLSAAERGTRTGYPTANSCLAYLSSYFAMRSFLAFLGVGYTELNSRAYVFDIWPELGARTAQGKIKPWEATVRCSFCGPRFNHQKHWDLFIHVIRRFREHDLPDESVNFFRVLKEHKIFSVRRNAIQYQGKWPFEDIIQELCDKRIGVITNERDDRDAEQLDFDLIIAQQLLFPSILLFKEIAATTKKLEKRMLQLKALMSTERHPIVFSGNWNRELVVPMSSVSAQS